jgi:hypothetical protein
MDFTQDSGKWIHASKSGSALNTDDTSASIQQHDGDSSAFSWDMSKAKGGDSVNPFVSSSGGGASGTGSSCVPRPTGSSTSASGSAASAASAGVTTTAGGWGPGSHGHGSSFVRPTASPTGDSDHWRRDVVYCDENPSSSTPSQSGDGDSDATESSKPPSHMMIVAHGTLAALAMVVFFPFGAISIRLFSFSGLVWVHAGIQVLGYLIYIAAFGLGVYIATKGNYVSLSNSPVSLVLTSR